MALTFAVAASTKSERELESRYSAEAKSAFQSGNYARAVTCYERLAATSSEPEPRFRLALAADAMGDRARATSVILSLAPDDLSPDVAKGYAPAHYWRARQLLALSSAPRGAIAVAEMHLLQAIAGDLDEKDAAHGLLGQLYLTYNRNNSSNRLEQAEFHLTKAAATRPIFRLALARTFALRGNTVRAKQEAELASRFFRDRAREDSTNITARLAWAEATSFLEDYLGAVTILEEGLQGTGDAVYRLALAKVYLGWHDLRKKQPTVTPAELLVLLDKGLTYDTANKELLNRLLDLLRVGGPESEKARAFFTQLLAKGGTALASIHFALAIDARLRNDADDEKLHLEQAFRLDSKTGIIANNLAWVLSQPPNPDLNRALALIDAAIEREPTHRTYRDTRGHIYLSLHRWQDALADLELVLTTAPDTPGLHDALADAYAHVGNAGLAAKHRKLAGEPAAKGAIE
jgi:tetratricopeptide (TPR) repeat protein